MIESHTIHATWFLPIIDLYKLAQVISETLTPICNFARAGCFRDDAFHSAPFALKIPANLAEGAYRIVIGVYNPYASQRLTTEQGDQVLLATVHVSAAG